MDHVFKLSDVDSIIFVIELSHLLDRSYKSTLLKLRIGQIILLFPMCPSINHKISSVGISIRFLLSFTCVYC
jgi:hypothetical protein